MMRNVISKFYSYISIILLLSLGVSVNAESIDTELNITNINCGVQGDSVLLESKGNYLLMDTCLKADSNLIKYLKDNEINTFDIYVSHYHNDHFQDVSTIIQDEYFNIGKVYLPNTAYIESNVTNEIMEAHEATYTYMNNYLNRINAMVNVINGAEIPITYLWKDDSFRLGDATIDIVGPVANLDISDFFEVGATHYINNNSLVAIVKVGNTKYFTAGDIEKEEEEALIASNIDISAEIMKLSHHAGYTSNTPQFLRKVNPKYSIATINGKMTTTGSYVGSTVTEITKFSNLYNRYNGSVTINIKNDDITVLPKVNYKTIVINYVDVDTNEILDTKNYNFNATKPYFIYDYIKSFDNYEYDYELNESQIQLYGELPEDSEYNLYYKLIKNDSNNNAGNSNETDTDADTENIIEITDDPADTNNTEINDLKTDDSTDIINQQNNIKEEEKIIENPPTGNFIPTLMVFLILLAIIIKILQVKKKKKIIKL